MLNLLEEGIRRSLQKEFISKGPKRTLASVTAVSWKEIEWTGRKAQCG